MGSITYWVVLWNLRQLQKQNQPYKDEFWWSLGIWLTSLAGEGKAPRLGAMGTGRTWAAPGYCPEVDWQGPAPLPEP